MSDENEKKIKEDNRLGLHILAIVGLQTLVMLFAIVVFVHYVFGSGYFIWEAAVKIIIGMMTVFFGMMYISSESSKNKKKVYRLYFITFVVLSAELALYYGYLYLIGI